MEKMLEFVKAERRVFLSCQLIQLKLQQQILVLSLSVTKGLVKKPEKSRESREEAFCPPLHT